MSFKGLAVTAAAAVALAGCNMVNPMSGSVDPGFGEAVKYDQAIQTINPAPVYAAGGEQPGSNGEKGAAAVTRYREGKVKEVEQQITTSGQGGSGGGGPQ